jgi:hypothetical protein
MPAAVNAAAFSNSARRPAGSYPGSANQSEAHRGGNVGRQRIDSFFTSNFCESMPSVRIMFIVELVERPQRAFAYAVHITDAGAFQQIEAIGFPASRGGTNPVITIETDEGDTRIPPVLAILERCGFTPSSRALTPIKTNFSEFGIIRTKTFSHAEVDGAPLLRLVPKGPYQQFAEYCYPTVRDMPPTPLTLEEKLPFMRKMLGDDESGWRIKADARLKKSTQMGSLGVLHVFLVGPLLKEKFEAANLRGLVLTPVRYDKPAKAVRQLWQFGNSLKMPPCLLPRLTQMGEDFTPERERDGAVWDEGGYYPQILTFYRAAVESLLPIDVAVTQEKVGDHGGFLHREIIVSQRFRQLLLNERIHNVGYVPVRLVD